MKKSTMTKAVKENIQHGRLILFRAKYNSQAMARTDMQDLVYDVHSRMHALPSSDGKDFIWCRKYRENCLAFGLAFYAIHDVLDGERDVETVPEAYHAMEEAETQLAGLTYAYRRIRGMPVGWADEGKTDASMAIEQDLRYIARCINNEDWYNAHPEDRYQEEDIRKAYRYCLIQH